MDAILDAQFARIETALQNLIDSITTYNPSTSAALDLVTADDELSKGLEQLAQHQANHARILSLRRTAGLLDAQVKSSLALLADARKELTRSTLTPSQDGARDVPFDELIAYAQKISRYTVPPTYRPALPIPLRKKEQDGTADADSGAGKTTRSVSVVEEANAVKMANGTPSSNQPGTNTPAHPAPGDTAAPAPAEEAALPLSATVEEDRGIGWATLNPEQRAWVDQISELQFVPWPRDQDVKEGALARIHAMVEKGMDPATMTKNHAELEEEKRLRGEQEQKELDEMRERNRREARPQAHPEPQQSVQSGGAFAGLDLYDPDEG
ncbi:hypothetical protein NA57DRAFT_73301 [Rhizodiscina lignyota]|uniref:Mediator of RNA polymerase II transcription subunit 4 n=1 Tax=Rhizodiscina lignyota TaxID=1504668 RepID=A0A9P4MBX2_9PEZI|nr:hypothetical protein NA57DRAFT_73301 [Rhizodiscina lignyota]